MTGRLLPAAFCVAAGAAAALDLPAGAELAAERLLEQDRVHLHTGPWAEDGAPGLDVTGRIAQRAYRIPATSLTTGQLVARLRQDLAADGYEILFDCADRGCGGFDFRYGLDILPEPEMHVNLGDFHYLLAGREGTSGELLAVLVSRSGSTGFVHLTQAGDAAPPEVAPAPAPVEGAPPPPVPDSRPPDPPPDRAEVGRIAGALAASGRAVLTGLVFAPGSSRLEDRPFPVLAELAAWLEADPEAQIVLVGHSDAVGDLRANIDLSRRRAASVAERLVSAHGIEPSRLSSEGVGYLAPLAPSTTDQGRAINRRVEAVLPAVE